VQCEIDVDLTLVIFKSARRPIVETASSSARTSSVVDLALLQSASSLAGGAGTAIVPER
jgi:hypothetical protein